VNASEVTLSQVSNAAIAGVSGITSAFADASSLTISNTSLLLRDATIRGDCVRACAVAGIAHYNPNDGTQVDMTDTAFGSEASSVSLVTAEVTSVVGVATNCVKTCYVNLERFALTLRGTTVELVASNPSDGVSIAIGGITSFTTSSSAIGARVTAAVGYITVKESTIVASTFLGAVATAGFAMASTAGPSQANSITNVSVTLYKATAFANASGGGVAVAGASARTPNAVQLTSNDNAFIAIGSNLTLGGSGAAALGVSHTGTTNWLLESGNTFAACASTVQAIVTPADSSMVFLGVMSIPPRPVLGRTSNLVALNSNFTSPDANLRILSGLHPNEINSPYGDHKWAFEYVRCLATNVTRIGYGDIVTTNPLLESVYNIPFIADFQTGDGPPTRATLKLLFVNYTAIGFSPYGGTQRSDYDNEFCLRRFER
jgi:hypothetical protein